MRATTGKCKNSKKMMDGLLRSHLENPKLGLERREMSEEKRYKKKEREIRDEQKRKEKIREEQRQRLKHKLFLFVSGGRRNGRSPVK